MIERIAVSATLRASHVDRILDEGLHDHVWTVWAWWPARPHRDLRPLRTALEAVLAQHQGAVLPDDLWAQEDLGWMAAQVLVLQGCIGVSVERPGFRSEVWL